MKNRRSTILVAVMVALIGTPKVWQEVGNLLASLQHKTQSKLLSMVLSSQVQEESGELLAANTNAYQPVACPASKLKQVVDDSRSGAESPSRKAKIRVRAATTAVSAEEHYALASMPATEFDSKAFSQDSKKSLTRQSENYLAIHSLDSLPRELSMNKGDVNEFVALPQMNAVAPVVWVEKEADLQKLKKALEDGKAIRQKVRYVIGKNTVVVPST